MSRPLPVTVTLATLSFEGLKAAYDRKWEES